MYNWWQDYIDIFDEILYIINKKKEYNKIKWKINIIVHNYYRMFHKLFSL